MPKTHTDRKTDLKKVVEAMHNSQKDRDMLTTLYTVLDMFDSKASGLLTVNSILSAFFIGVLVLPESVHSNAKNIIFILLILLTLILLVVSSIYCLAIMEVKWPCYDNINLSETEPFKKEIDSLVQVIDDRTGYYHHARFLTLVVLLVSTIILSIFIVLSLTK